MKYVNEYRDGATAKKYAEQIRRLVTRNWVLMEVCGGQTHTIIRFGIDRLIPKEIQIVHGPGCPVCVTPIEQIDRAIELTKNSKIIFCTFGDMLRVPGSRIDLSTAKAEGGDVRIIYSPLDALNIAASHPDREVVLFAIGFETTAPANAMAVFQAKKLKLSNFSVLVSHVLVPAAIESLLSSSDNKVQGFLAAGHVCTIMGYTEYEPLAFQHRVPIVVTGFEPLDILQGIYMCIKQLEEGQFVVENQYTRSVNRQGNERAQELIRDVFCITSRKWRGLGEIQKSGLSLSTKYGEFDAEKRFPSTLSPGKESSLCMGGSVLRGLIAPSECPSFGNACTPGHPLGPTMVSSEGACAAYYRYRLNEGEKHVR